MGLEVATYINGLVATNPTQGDLVSAGDDHIRLLKTTLKNTFPNLTNAVTVTQDELNRLSGVSSNVQVQLNEKAALEHGHSEEDIADGNVLARLSSNETISGIWNFVSRPQIAGNSVLDSASAILESQITDGSLLARLAGNETITGGWNFSTAPLIAGRGVLRWAVNGFTGGAITIQEGGSPAPTGSPGSIVMIY